MDVYKVNKYFLLRCVIYTISKKACMNHIFRLFVFYYMREKGILYNKPNKYFLWL